MKTDCVFCDILGKRAPASVVYEDERVLAFMDHRPVRPGQILVIPKSHIDHFIDVDESTAHHMWTVGRKIGLKIQQEFSPDRIGFAIHGYGVPHAHLIVLPLHDRYDLTSQRLAAVEDGRVVFSPDRVPQVDIADLEAQARRLRAL